MSDIFDARTGEPDSFIAGDFVKWKRTDLDDEVAAAYTLRYIARLGSSGSAAISKDAAIVSGEYVTTLNSSETAEFSPGRWYWEAYIINGSDRIRVDSGQWDVGIDLALDQSDPRSHAEIMLAKIQSILEKRADNDVENYSIGGRSITKMNADELISWRNYYRTEVETEENRRLRAQGKKSRNTIAVRFTG